MSDTDALAADSGALSIDQAVSLMSEAETPSDAENKDGAANSEADASAQTAEAGEGEADEQDQPSGQTEGDAEEEAESEEGAADGGEGEEEEAESEELPPIEPPQYWTPEHKALFANLPRDGQEATLVYEQQRAGFMRSAVAEAQAAQTAAQQERAAFLEKVKGIDELLPQAVHVFTARWQDIDLLKIAETEGPEMAAAVRDQALAEQQAVQRLQEAAKQSEDEAFRAFIASEQPKLLQRIPELADPAKAQAIMQEINGILDDEAYTPDERRMASAKDLRIAWEAAQYRKIVKSGLLGKQPQRTGSAPTKPTNAARPSAPLRPAAAPARPTTPQRQAEAAKDRFSRTGNIDDAVALLDAREKRRA